MAQIYNRLKCSMMISQVSHKRSTGLNLFLGLVQMFYIKSYHQYGVRKTNQLDIEDCANVYL